MSCPHLNEIGKRIVKEIHCIGCVRTIEGLLIICEDCGNNRELVREIKFEETRDEIRI